MDAVTENILRDLAELKGQPLPAPQRCLRLSCHGLAAAPSPLCQRCSQGFWSELDLVRKANIGSRLGYANGVWPVLDQLGTLDELEAMSDAELRALAKQRRLLAQDPELHESRQERFAREKLAQDEERNARVINRLQREQARIEMELAERLGAQ